MDRQSSHTELVQRLFVKHIVAIRAFVRAFVPDFNRADDVLQDSFLTVTAKADMYQEGTNFLAWASAIAKLKVLECHRKNQAAGQTLSPEVIDALWAMAPIALPTDDFQTTLRECLEELAPSARQAIEMRYGEACKPAEVARRLSWKPEAVYVTLSRARASLRDCIDRKIKQQELR
jgi:RNA polymerase sigma-70 factor (ECF subfamily)